MVTRIGGLASGMDIDELVNKLMTAERAPLNKLNQKKTTYEWQRDAYRSVNTKLKTFDTYIADNLILKTLNSKTATSSNSNLVSATATGSATGTISIEGVSQLAKSARGVGNQINANGATKVSDLMTSMPNEIKLSSIKTDGTMSSDVAITLDANMTIDQLVSKINSSNAGVSAVFESGKLSITAKNTGDNKNGAEVKVIAGGSVFNALGFSNITGDAGDLATGGMNAVFQVNGIATERSTNNFAINGYNITLNSAFNADKTTAERYNTALLEWKNTHDTVFDTSLTNAENRQNTAISAYNTAVDSQNTAKQNLFGNLTQTDYDNFNKIGNLSFVEKVLDGNYVDSYVSMISINSEASYNSMLNATTLTDDVKYLKDNNITYEQFNGIRNLGKDKLEGLSKSSYFNSLGNDFLAGLTDKEKELLQNIQPPNLTDTDLNNKITNWENSSNADATQNEIEKALATKLSNLSETQKSALTRVLKDAATNYSTVTSGLNSYTELAQANKKVATTLQEKNVSTTEYQQLVDRKTKAEEDFTVAYKAQTGSDLNGSVDIKNLEDVTVPTNSSNAITLSSTTNVDDMMTKIKEFVTTYNGLIKDLTDQTKQTKYRDYTPLTAEQKEEMSENEIKLWEEKAKSGLLRNDSLISNGLLNMRSLIYQSNLGLEGSKYNTLFNIGITTSKNYNDGGTLEIDEAKLRSALEEDPDAVERLLKNADGKKDDTVQVRDKNGNLVTQKADTRGYLDKLRESMKSLETNIEKKAGRSTMTDAQYAIGKSLMDMETRIKTWQDKLENIESRYWKQFTAMESAINKSNQQSSLFTQG